MARKPVPEAGTSSRRPRPTSTHATHVHTSAVVGVKSFGGKFCVYCTTNFHLLYRTDGDEVLYFLPEMEAVSLTSETIYA